MGSLDGVVNAATGIFNEKGEGRWGVEKILKIVREGGIRFGRGMCEKRARSSKCTKKSQKQTPGLCNLYKEHLFGILAFFRKNHKKTTFLLP